MDLLNDLLAGASKLVPVLLVLFGVLVALFSIDWFLKRRWKDNPNAQFRFQLLMLALSGVAVLLVIVALPIDVETRGQLLSLVGILLSAAIALSSTTFIGNIMAGIMLRAVSSVRPGDFITVAELTGRISEMGLLHTEVQTEFRDLVTIPNLHMVTRPMQVVRSSGTIITAEISLGYDVAYAEVYRILGEATAKAGLENGFVQVRKLGDFSITYRFAGLLEDVTSLISAHSRLREAALDALHAANIEIVSPTYMNTRALAPDQTILPQPTIAVAPEHTKQLEELAFDKAEDAASVEELRHSVELLEAKIKAAQTQKDETTDATVEQLTKRKERLLAQLSDLQEQLND